MQFTDRIDAIEVRRKRLNLPLLRVCTMAGVEYSTVSRWRKGTVPGVRLFEETMAKIEGVLDALEQKLVVDLTASKVAEPSRPAA